MEALHLGLRNQCLLLFAGVSLQLVTISASVFTCVRIQIVEVTKSFSDSNTILSTIAPATYRSWIFIAFHDEEVNSWTTFTMHRLHLVDPLTRETSLPWRVRTVTMMQLLSLEWVLNTEVCYSSMLTLVRVPSPRRCLIPIRSMEYLGPRPIWPLKDA